ncbi:MAG: methyltransferase domain-containing protein [Hespellia sp.]|nr:methyltransferase domain-containing protein [Hespellia sp.]
MEAYTCFASVYDIFMDNIPYDEWAAYLYDLFREYQVEGGLMLELGCGTGAMTERMAAYGYDMIGVDNSEEMLEAALEKKLESGCDILYLQQDMREFELYGTVRGIYSVCDSLNYITEEEDLVRVFHWVNNYLDPGGIFIFDFNTEYKYREILGQQTIAENREDCSFIWENEYDEEQKINTYDLTLFIRQQGKLYEKYEETHFQRAYTLQNIQELLERAGLLYITAYDAFTRNSPSKTSERICVIAREHGKEIFRKG